MSPNARRHEDKFVRLENFFASRNLPDDRLADFVLSFGANDFAIFDDADVASAQLLHENFMQATITFSKTARKSS